MSPTQNASAAGETWEQRWHPLREEWVIIAAHRNERPWTGDTVDRRADPVPAYSPDCYLCPAMPAYMAIVIRNMTASSFSTTTCRASAKTHRPNSPRPRLLPQSARKR